MAAVNTVAQLLIFTPTPSTNKLKNKGQFIKSSDKGENKAGCHLCPQDIKAAHRKGQKALKQHGTPTPNFHLSTFKKAWALVFALGEESDIFSISRWALNMKVQPQLHNSIRRKTNIRWEPLEVSCQYTQVI